MKNVFGSTLPWTFNYIARNEARLVAHKEIKHIHVCDLCNNFGKEYGDEKFEKHKSLVHENGVKAFTDEEFNVLDEDQLSEIKNGPIHCKKSQFIGKNKTY